MINGIDVGHATAKSPMVGNLWKEMSENERIGTINIAAGKLCEGIEVVEANELGHVSIILKEKLEASERGPLILEFEQRLKEKIDQGITVWHKPIGDKSSLRNLRGIEIKHDR